MAGPVVSRALVIALLCASGLLVGCQGERPDWADCVPNDPRACSTVAGIALGEFVASHQLDVAQCEGECHNPVNVGRAGLELRAPNHRPLIAIDEFGFDRWVLCRGTGTMCTVSGYLGVFVFTFSDAASLPVVVSCPGIAACMLADRYGS
jgi:hypothetical protein